MKYVVCFSGGHSSALAAIETVRKFGKENTILLNHNISPEVEHTDIKRFKTQVAGYLGVPITYANMPGYETLTPLKVAIELSGFQFQVGQALCTFKLKTEPFYKWLADNYPLPPDLMAGTLYEAAHPSEMDNEEITIVYGFDKDEPHRINRRAQLLGTRGYKTAFPLAFWERTIQTTEEIGIPRPITYENQKHANCLGCLKAGRQHWYMVYCVAPQLFEEALEAEEIIGHSIIKGVYLAELLPQFQQMKARGIVPEDITKAQTFWARVKRELNEEKALPCECTV
jgi:hypothetical protein